jgi:hypothetical protein
MADIKDTVASHISTNWNAAVLGGSGAVPTVDAVGPEDIKKPTDYPEAILVYNERVTYDRIYSQGTYGDRHTRVYILLTAHTKSGCTKVHFRAFIDELKSVFGSAISGFDLQLLDPEENVTKTTGVAGGMYQASFVLHLYEYGVSTSSAASGGSAGASYWDEYFVVTQASANLTNETVLSTKLLAYDNDIIPDADSSRDLGSTTKYWAEAYIDALTTTGNATIGGDLTVTGSMNIVDADVPDTITLTNITQITTRKMDDLQAPDGTVDCGGQILDNVGALKNASAIKFFGSDDTDDYLALTTASSVPTWTLTGHPIMDLKSDGAYAKLRIYDEESYIECNDGTNSFLFYQGAAYSALICNRDFRMRATGDSDDYLYFATATHIARLLPVEDKIHCLGSASLSYDHVYSDDFDNTSPYEKIDKPLEKLKAIKDKKDDKDKDVIDYTSMPDFVRSHTRDPAKNKYETYTDEQGNEQQRVIERGPKDIVCDEGWSVNRMVLFLIQAVQELTQKVEDLEAKA